VGVNIVLGTEGFGTSSLGICFGVLLAHMIMVWLLSWFSSRSR
jgi:hypothetical protein